MLGKGNAREGKIDESTAIFQVHDAGKMHLRTSFLPPFRGSTPFSTKSETPQEYFNYSRTIFVDSGVSRRFLSCRRDISFFQDHFNPRLPDPLLLILTSRLATFSCNLFFLFLSGKLFEILSVIVGEAERYDVRV